MYSIEFSKKAEQQLYKLPLELQKRMVSYLERIRIRPFHFVQRIVNNQYYKLRVGNYRIILDVVRDKLIIYVIKVGHRKNIYER